MERIPNNELKLWQCKLTIKGDVCTRCGHEFEDQERVYSNPFSQIIIGCKRCVRR